MLATSRGTFRDPTLASSNSDQDVGFGGSAWETPRHQLPAPRFCTFRWQESPEATVENPEPPDSSRSTRDLPDGRWQPADSEGGRPEITFAHPRASQRADPRPEVEKVYCRVALQCVTPVQVRRTSAPCKRRRRRMAD
jgi:hypothetical protein